MSKVIGVRHRVPPCGGFYHAQCDVPRGVAVALLETVALVYSPACQEAATMDSKVYLEWRAKLNKWVVEYQGQTIAEAYK
jgi:hypothetical protein